MTTSGAETTSASPLQCRSWCSRMLDVTTEPHCTSWVAAFATLGDRTAPSVTTANNARRTMPPKSCFAFKIADGGELIPAGLSRAHLHHPYHLVSRGPRHQEDV